jgi:hypothetical protein
MAELKTRPGGDDVKAFLDAVPDEQRRADAKVVCDLMAEVTGEPPVMWGESIVGFGSRHLRYESGRELDWMVIGFSPRKASLTLYLMEGYDGYGEQLGRLGKFTTGKSCLYIKRLSDVDFGVLRELVTSSVALNSAD